MKANAKVLTIGLTSGLMQMPIGLNYVQNGQSRCSFASISFASAVQIDKITYQVNIKLPLSLI